MFSSAFLAIFTLFAIALGLALYFLPTIIAQQKKHPSLGGIFVLNLLLGWSLLGWIGALVWALSNPQPVVIVQNGPAYLSQNYGAAGYQQQPGYPPQPAYPQQQGYPQQPSYPQPTQVAGIAPVDSTEYVAQPAVVFTPGAGTDASPPPASPQF